MRMGEARTTRTTKRVPHLDADQPTPVSTARQESGQRAYANVHEEHAIEVRTASE